MQDDTERTQAQDEAYDDASHEDLEVRYNSGEREPVDQPGSEPDVFLEVSELRVEEITLDVEDLRARVSLQAEVLELLKLGVGADVQLGKVHVDIKGVDAQALLKVRLDRVEAIVGRVLTTIDRNPQILEQVTSAVGGAVGELSRGAGETVGELGRGAGETVGELGRGAGETVGELGRGAGETVGELGRGAGETVGELGREAGSAVGDVGRQAGKAVGDVGESAGAVAQEGVRSAVKDVGEAAADVAGEAVEVPGQTGDTADKVLGRTGSGERDKGEREETSQRHGLPRRPKPRWDQDSRRKARTRSRSAP